MKNRAFPLLTICLLAVSFPASADIIWPAAALEARLLTWWAIALGLLLEFAVVWRVFRLPVKRAALATAVANGISTLAGIVLIPLAGIIWVPLGVLLRFPAVFSPIGWITTFATACLINTAIEAAVYRRSFDLTVRGREFVWVLFANALSVGVAVGSFLVSPMRWY
jgi:hypothetical protein